MLSLILKLLPFLWPILKGIFGALKTTHQTYNIDPKKLQALVEKITTEEIHKVVEAHKTEIVTFVPTDAEVEREKRLNELEKILEADQKHYEGSTTSN